MIFYGLSNFILRGWFSATKSKMWRHWRFHIHINRNLWAKSLWAKSYLSSYWIAIRVGVERVLMVVLWWIDPWDDLVVDVSSTMISFGCCGLSYSRVCRRRRGKFIISAKRCNVVHLSSLCGDFWTRGWGTLELSESWWVTGQAYVIRNWFRV